MKNNISDLILLESFFQSDERGDFIIKVKTNKGFQNFHYATHPFDLVGWSK